MTAQELSTATTKVLQLVKELCPGESPDMILLQSKILHTGIELLAEEAKAYNASRR